jgi:glycosyltransferase involved in cell wall biosynthesis
MANPLVSILVPFHNTEAYITECLQSVLEQDYSNWEVIAVDDQSTDGSWKLAELFATSDHRFRILKNRGKGIIPALQTAFANSSGHLITRMDSDDIMPVDKLKHLSTSLLEHGPGHLATGKVRYFSIRGISEGYARYEEWLNRLTEEGSNFSEIYKECPVASPCWMAFRTDLEKCGAFGEERYPEDYDLCFRFYANKLRIIPCDKILHYWRDYDLRTSRTSAHYAQNYFLDIKLHYFLMLDHHQNRPLLVWGAGNKGKAIASALSGRGLDFRWLCDNPKKIGKSIYGKALEHYSVLRDIPGAQSIITVANPDSQHAIRQFLQSRGQLTLCDYFFFC